MDTVSYKAENMVCIHAPYIYNVMCLSLTVC